MDQRNHPELLDCTPCEDVINPQSFNAVGLVIIRALSRITTCVNRFLHDHKALNNSDEAKNGYMHTEVRF
jgi:hypothetical protein